MKMIGDYDNDYTIIGSDTDTDTDTDTIDEENSITEDDPIDRSNSTDIPHKTTDFKIIPYREFDIDRTYSNIRTFYSDGRKPSFYIKNPRNLPIHFNKAKPIVKELIQHLNLNVDLARPVYMNSSNGLQNPSIKIDFINMEFCRQINGYNSFLIYYSDRSETILIYHPKWNIILDKTYSTYSIQIFSYSNKILRQESINYINSITYKQNGLIIERRPCGCKIILPSSIYRNNSNSPSILDCFIMWKII